MNNISLKVSTLFNLTGNGYICWNSGLTCKKLVNKWIKKYVTTGSKGTAGKGKWKEINCTKGNSLKT